MRVLIVCLLALLSLPTFAADWGRYENARFGYAIAVPPGFSGLGEADNGDGQVFTSASGREKLTVWGSNIVDTDFAGEIAQRKAWAKQDGWKITYQSTTPKAASYSGTRSGSVLYARIVSLCGGTQAAFFNLEYSNQDVVKLDPVVSRLVQSLKASASC